MPEYQSETDVQKGVVTVLKRCAKPGLVWLHVPNQGKRSLRLAQWLKSMGVRKGVSDLLFWYQGASYALELKAIKGRLSDEQQKFLADFTAAGGMGAVTYGLKAALAQLQEWNLITARFRT